MHRSGRADYPIAPAAGAALASPSRQVIGGTTERSGHQASQKPADRTGQNWAVNSGLDM